jgi:glycosyltransferase involved in cell wall biosynthesis
MKIAVNTRLLLKNKLEGIGWFTYEVLKRIVKQHPEHEFHFIFDRPYDKEFIFADNVITHHIGPQSRHPVLWYLWFEWSVPLLLKRIKPDVFISPEGYLPLKSKMPMLNVMHDIAYEHYPDTVPNLVSKYYRRYFPLFAKKADLVATVSEFSKKDIVKYYNIPEEKIKVVYNGINEIFAPVSESVKEQTRAKWSAGKPYFLFVGGLYPRKNLANLMLAFDKFKQQHASDIKLLLVGKKAFGAEELENIHSGLKFKDDVVFLGRINSNEELNNIISASIAMTYVSVFEGFGIPCLEAMRCGTAVITSDTSSLPEVCGDAAVYVDPFSIESIAEGMERVVNNPELRIELIEKGKMQAAKFNWDRTASLMWDAIMEVVQPPQ